jgi:uncharacterized membrane protein YeaQ/YmgE (transglycosylase-associated protein family)
VEIVTMLVVGLIPGLLARAIMPGSDTMGWIPNVILGIVGSFVGGLLASFLLHDRTTDYPTGIVGSVIGALIVLGIWHIARRRRVTT